MRYIHLQTYLVFVVLYMTVYQLSFNAVNLSTNNKTNKIFYNELLESLQLTGMTALR